MIDCSSFIDTNGAQLYAELLGMYSGHRVLMVHGGPGADFGYLRPQCDAIASMTTHGEPILQMYYDQRGSGQSVLDEGFSPAGYQTHIEDIESIRRCFAMSSFSLCGYSFGGLLAILYALKYPLAIKRLILISPAPTYALARAEMKENLQQAASRPDILAMKAAFDAEESTLSDEEKKRRRFALAVAGYFYNAERAKELTPFRVVQRAEQAMWESLGEYDFREQLSALANIPTLVLHGTNDVIPIASAKDTAMRMGATFIELPHCGHVPYIEAKDALWSHIQTFFNQT